VSFLSQAKHDYFATKRLIYCGRIFCFRRRKSEFASQNNFRKIGKLFARVKALSGPESPTLPEGEWCLRKPVQAKIDLR
jgi:hypothetical protein